MAAPIYYNKFTKLNNADATTGWTITKDAGGGGTPSANVDTDIYAEGAAALSLATRLTTTSARYALPGTTDMTNLHVGGWFFNIAGGALDLFANGGLRLYAYDGTNWGAWAVAGRDTYPGGWQFYMIDCNRPFDFNGGADPSITAITHIGYQFVIGAGKTGVQNCYWDAIFYGDPTLVAYSGDTTDPSSLEGLQSASAALNNGWGLLQDRSNQFFVGSAILVGSASIDTYFADTGKSLTFIDQPVSGTLYRFEFTGSGTTASFGDYIGSSSDGVTFGGVTLQAETGSLRYEFRIAPEVRKVGIYDSAIRNARQVYIGDSGSSANALTGSTFEFINSRIVDSFEIQKNINDDPLFLNSQFSFTTSSFGTPSHSMVLYDTGSIDGGGLFPLANYGYTSPDNDVSESFSIYNTNWSSLNQYVRVYNNKIWNIYNPTWTVTSASVTELVFNSPITNTLGSYIIERYSETSYTVSPEGTALYTSSVFVTWNTDYGDSSPSDRNSTVYYSDSNGVATGSISTNTYYSSSALEHLVDSNNDFGTKVYQYGRLPFIGVLGRGSSEIVAVYTLLQDSNISEPVKSNALSNGSGIQILLVTESLSDNATSGLLVEFDNGSGTLASGSLIGVSGISDTTGSFIEYATGDDSSGKMWLRSNTYNMRDIVSQSLLFEIGGDWIGEAANVPQPFSWEIDANTYSLTIVYDYLYAQFNTVPFDESTIFNDIIIWGHFSYPSLLQVGGSGYFTSRNNKRFEPFYQGVYVSRKGAGTVQYFTDDSGSTFVPPVSVTHTLTGLVSGSEVTYVSASSDDIEIYHVESAPANGQTDYAYVYQTDRVVNIYINEPKYVWKGIFNVTLGNTDASIPVEQDLDINYNNPL